MHRDSYAQLLRAIGQDLEKLTVEKLSIEVDESVFIATLEIMTRASEPPAKEAQPKAGFFRALLKPETLAPPPPVQIQTIERRYTIGDLERLATDDRRISTRDEDPDFYNLGEFLGVIGAYLDKNHARLLKLSKQDVQISLHYENLHGQRITEEQPVSSFYDLYLHMFKRRHSPNSTSP